MNVPLVSRISIVFVIIISLASCTNTREDQSVLSLLRLVQASLQSNEPMKIPDRQVIDIAVTRALASTENQLALLTLEDNDMIALITVIESNGPYRTWASLGSSERRSVTSRSGFISATRGLGNDLMSSDVNGLLDNLDGTDMSAVRQVLRHLDGENVIVETVLQCEITDRRSESYEFGEISETGTRIVLACQNEPEVMEVSYLVTKKGRVVEARQWLGPTLGMSTFQQLR